MPAEFNDGRRRNRRPRDFLPPAAAAEEAQNLFSSGSRSGVSLWSDRGRHRKKKKKIGAERQWKQDEKVRGAFELGGKAREVTFWGYKSTVHSGAGMSD